MHTSPIPERQSGHAAGLVRQPAERDSDDSGKHIESLGFRNGHSLPWGRRKERFNGACWVCYCVSPTSGEMTSTTISDVSTADIWQMWHCPIYQSASCALKAKCGSPGECVVDQYGWQHIACF